ncbi:restriction system protein [Raineyella antarctica]|uniref:Restriction system protein n=1 Tax=Raineyella antarctica TaxID=1577474 RepID=A0A1G6I9N5_9ACTN|nr:restriction endonuclease [Raineyella antarctica]SDC03237.1 restriction system protein [Raineyella antarctica]
MTEVPTWEYFGASALRFLSDGVGHKAMDVREAAADELGLTEQARQEMMKSGQRRWENRANWALSRLAQYGAARRPARGIYQITEAGRTLLAQHPHRIRLIDLGPLLGSSVESVESVEPIDHALEVAQEIDPVEQIETGVARLQASVGADLLTRLNSENPAFFEQAILGLFLAMGYGGAGGKVTGSQRSSDGEIDGFVDQDALGLSRIYVQAKRYALDASVGRPEIQAFVGALHGNQANQGVFTTGRFATGARAYVDSVPTRVILIDGQRLAALMVRYGVGVQVRRTVQIVEVDEDFFE